MTRSHFSSSILTASVKITSGGRADADSIVTETEKEILENSTQPIRPVTHAIIV